MSNFDRNITRKIETLKELTNIELDAFSGLTKIYIVQADKVVNGKIVSMVKIGDTKNQPLSRVRSWIRTSNLQMTAPLKSFIAMKDNGEMFRDYDLHKFLAKKGYNQEMHYDLENHLGEVNTKSEWFLDLDYETFLELMEKFVQKKVFEVYSLRPAQIYFTTKFSELLVEGIQYFNLDLSVRSGKSLGSLHINKMADTFGCYISKNLPSQYSIEKEQNIYGVIPHHLTQSIHGIDDKDDTTKVSTKVKKIIANIMIANVLNQKIMFFVDEVDNSSHTAKSIKVFKAVIKWAKKMNLFGGFVTMTGTRAFRGLKVLEAVKNKPDKIGEISLAYYEMQILQPDTTVSRDFRNIAIFDSTGDFSSISDSMKSTKGRKSLAKAIKYFISSKGEETYSINYDSRFPHYFMKFATVGKANAIALVKLLNSKKKYTAIDNKKVLYVNINGDYTTSGESEEFCTKIIEANQDIVIVFITQGMATTSFSIDSIGNTFVFSDNQLTADDNQALHRSCTWTDGKTNANLVYITTQTSSDFKWEDPFEAEANTGYGRDGKKRVYKEILNNNSIMHFVYKKDKDSVTPAVIIDSTNAEIYLDKKAQAFDTINKIANIMIETINITLPDHLVKNIFGDSSTKSTTAKGESFKPFGEEEPTPDSIEAKKRMDSRKKIILQLSQEIINIPALCIMTEKSLNQVDNNMLEKFSFDAKLFKEYYGYPLIADRLDSIYSRCKDDKTTDDLMMNYFQKLTTIIV